MNLFPVRKQYSLDTNDPLTPSYFLLLEWQGNTWALIIKIPSSSASFASFTTPPDAWQFPYVTGKQHQSCVIMSVFVSGSHSSLLPRCTVPAQPCLSIMVPASRRSGWLLVICCATTHSRLPTEFPPRVPQLDKITPLSLSAFSK